MIVRKRAKDTLTAFELDCGEVLEFTLADGTVNRLELINAGASVLRTTLKELKVPEKAGRTDIAFFCELKINGAPFRMDREFSTQKSFYEPLEVAGMHLWFDAAADIFEFLLENHGDCRPGKKARFAVKDARLSICPQPIHPFCPLPKEGLKIGQCFRGEDCWMGAYNGAEAHGGLDINHAAGTPLWTPLALNDQFYFNSLEMGHNNNRWRGIHRFQNGAEWVFQAHHMTELLVPEHRPLEKGVPFARAAGVWTGAVEHSHFVFKIHDEGETVLLDPWILFWQMYRDGESFPSCFY